MLQQDPPKTLRFNVRKGPIVTFATIGAVVGLNILWVAFDLAQHPGRHFDALMDLLPNPVRVGALALVGGWLMVAAFASALRAVTFLGALVIRPDGILFESGAGTWTTPWRDIRSIRIRKITILNKIALIERDQATTPSPWFVTLWRHRRYGCDPDGRRLSLARMPAADNGNAISPEDLVRIIEDYRRVAEPGAADRSRAA